MDQQALKPTAAPGFVAPFPLFGDTDAVLAGDTGGAQLATWLEWIANARAQVRRERGASDAARREEEAMFLVALGSSEHVLKAVWNALHHGAGFKPPALAAL